MNIIRMTGGLGNQMFQYALYLKLKALGRKVKFDDKTEYEGRDARPIQLWVFGITYPAATVEELNVLTDGFMKLSHRIRRKLFGRKSREYAQRDSNFDEQVLQSEPAYLTGYFQSERYFEGVEEQVREAFQFSDQIWEKIPEKLAVQIKDYARQIKESEAVSVHIRRGDYLENDAAYGGICTEEYYQKAISLVKEKCPEAVFFLFSNDPAWSEAWLLENYKEDYKAGRFVLVSGTTEDTGYLDMYLMSLCKHHIVANSSFSWWGAWLGANSKKTVVAPSKWFGDQDCRDIYTKEMLKVSPKGEVME